MSELLAVEGQAQDIGGYFNPNEELAAKAMRPVANCRIHMLTRVTQAYFEDLPQAVCGSYQDSQISSRAYLPKKTQSRIIARCLLNHVQL
jgi:hypothetical protein